LDRMADRERRVTAICSAPAPNDLLDSQQL
jgi:hypothetical protein